MELFNQAISLHQQGRLPEARQRYEQWRRMNPGDINALQLLSVCLAQMGELPQALQMLDQAIALAPQQPAFHNNRANMLRLLGRLPEALQSCTRAIQLKPDYAEAYNNRGNVQQDLKLTDLALKDYAEAIRLNPGYAEAIYNAAVAQQSQQKHAEAIDGLKKVLALAPGQAQTLARLAVSYSHLRMHENAQAAIDQALEAQPNQPEFLLIAATLALDRARYEAAMQLCEKLLELQPDHDLALAKLALVHQILKNTNKSHWYIQRALQKNDRNFEIWIVKGHLHYDSGQLDLAAECYRKAIEINPNSAQAHLFEGLTFGRLKKWDDSQKSLVAARAAGAASSYLLGALLEAKLNTNDWSSLDKLVTQIKLEAENQQFIDQPLSLIKILDDPLLLKKNAERLSLSLAEATSAHSPKFSRREPRRSKIRIGYFSPDFGDHPVARLLLETLETHDRERFELHAFSIAPRQEDDIGRQIRNCCDRYTDVSSMSDPSVADLSRQVGIDIAIDLTGHTFNNRLGIFAYRAAPIQVNFLGFPGTSGAPFMDYLIADPIVIPETASIFYTEKIAYLPHQFMPIDTRQVIDTSRVNRASQGLPTSGFVFCGFNHLSKLTPAVFHSWMKILKSCGDSVLWLQAEARVHQTIQQHAQRCGVEPERLVFADRLPNHSDHLGRMALADLFLDMTPYGAHTTAMEALWCGLPVLTCLGQSFASRVAGSLVRSAGLSELATQSWADYENLAIKIAQTPGHSEILKQQLAEKRATSPLFDNRIYTKNLENLYEQMYQRHLDRLAPASLRIT